MSEVSAAVASPRDRAISDVLFVVQIVCAMAMGTAQIALMLETVQGASITWFAFWFAFLLINLVLGQLTPDRGRIQVADHDANPVELVDIATLDGADLDRLQARERARSGAETANGPVTGTSGHHA